MRRHLPGFLLGLAACGLLSITLTGCADLIAKLKNRGADAGDDAAVATAEAEDAGQVVVDDPTAEPLATATALATAGATATTTTTTARPVATDAGASADASALDAGASSALVDAAVAAIVDAGALPTDAGGSTTIQLPQIFDGGPSVKIKLPTDGFRLKKK